MGDIRAIAVATNISPPASPCGMCRQAIREFCEPSMSVLMYDKHGRFVVMTVEQLLPMSFGPESLLGPDQIPNHLDDDSVSYTHLTLPTKRIV